MARKSPTLKISLSTDLEAEVRRLKDKKKVPIGMSLAVLEDHLRAMTRPENLGNLVSSWICDRPVKDIPQPVAPPEPVGAPKKGKKVQAAGGMRPPTGSFKS